MRSESNNIGKDSLILTVSQFMVLGINMLNVMLLSRFRTLEEYGTYSQIIMVCTIVITFFSAGFSQCINYFLGKSESFEEKKKFIKSYYGVVTFIGMAGGLVTLVLLPLIQRYFGNAAMAKYWYVLLFYPISHILNAGIDRFFISYRRSKLLLVFRLSHSFLILGEAVLAIVLGLSFYQYMMIYTAAEVVFSAFTYLWIKKITGVLPFGFNKETVKEILVFAIPMAFASLVSTINTEMDKLIIGGLTDTETLAVYANAARELPFYIFSTSISSITMPFIVKKVSKKNYSDAMELWRKSINLSFYFMCFCVSVLFTFAPQVISVLYSDKYLTGTNVFRIYSLALLFRVTYYGMVLNSMGRTKAILRASVATMVINLVLDVVLYKLLGFISPEAALLGPAIATLLSVSVMNMYQLVLTKRLINVRFNDIYPIKPMSKIMLLNVVLSAVFFAVQQTAFRLVDYNRNVISIIIGAVWVATYALLVFKPVKALWKELNDSK